LLLPNLPSAGGALDASRIYIPLESEQVTALDRHTGKTVWTADIESVWPPIVLDGIVFVAASDEIHAVDAATGDRRWRSPVSAVSGAMATSGGHLVVPLGSGNITAFDAADGRLAWTTRIEGVEGPMEVVADEGGIYVSSGDGYAAALSLAGRLLWHRMLGGRLTRPALAPGRVVIGSSADAFFALDPRTGKERWRWRSGGDPVGAAGDASLIFLTALDNTVKAVNRSDGNQHWRTALTTRPAHPPRAFGGIVVVAGDSPTLSAFSAKKGQPMGTYDAPATLQGPPLIDPALRPFAVAIVAIMRDGNVVALTPAAMMFREPPAAPLTALPGRLLPREPPPAVRPPR
jgi:outer membrane protein assembly factor BamB